MQFYHTKVLSSIIKQTHQCKSIESIEHKLK